MYQQLWKNIRRGLKAKLYAAARDIGRGFREPVACVSGSELPSAAVWA
jgi:hypothetical protein